MSAQYPDQSASLERAEVMAKAELSRLSRLISRFDEVKRWLESSGIDPTTELKEWHSRYAVLLQERADLVYARYERSRAADCPTWVWGEEVMQPSTLPIFAQGAPQYAQGGWIEGHAPVTIAEGVSEHPSGAPPLTSTVFDHGSVSFIGNLVGTESPHWYRNWRFEAELPPSPFDADVHYSFYLFCHSWWYASSFLFDGWLTLFVTTSCETFFVIDLGWPGDTPNVGRDRKWVYVQGQMQAREGERLKVSFGTHVYAGVTDGEVTVRGGFMPHDRVGLRLDDPWPPPHTGKVYYVFKQKQVFAP